MKHLFILNPIAGRGLKIEKARKDILKIMSAQPEKWELYETLGVKDATRKVREAAASGEELRVYACGGDGTLNECVNGAVGSPNVAVTHFPAGTGNDFIKTFSSGAEQFFELENLLDPQEIILDLVEFEGRYGINICSVGLDARIAADVHKYNRLPGVKGKSAYFLSLLVNVVKGIAMPFEVEVGGKIFKREFTLICLCNGRSYGGAFTPVPEALPNDGVLEILLVEKTSRLKVLNLVKTYAVGQYRTQPKLITHMQGTEMTIRSDCEIAVNADGEILHTKEVTFKIVPRALRFFAPKGAGF